MSFDALTLSAVRDELAPLLTDARIQKAGLPRRAEPGVRAFAPAVGRTNVLLSANGEQSRVQRIDPLENCRRAGSNAIVPSVC